MKKILIYTFICLSFHAFAQLEQIKRVELVTSTELEEEHQIFTLKQEGILLLHTTTNIIAKELKIEFVKYDTTLQVIWQNQYKTNFEFTIEQHFQNQNFFYLLLTSRGEQFFKILKLNLKTGEMIYSEGNLLARMDINHFTVLGNKAIIGGKYNDRPVVVVYNFFDNQSKVLPELHANHFFINSILVNEEFQHIYILLRNEKNCQFSIKTYSYEGKLLRTEVVGEKGKVPIIGDILRKKDGSYMLVGNYAENCSNISIGLYLYGIEQEKPEIQYINFAELDNFFKHFSEKREKRIKTRLSEKKQKGKEIKLRYRLLLHDIIDTNDGWALLAEVYYPEFKQSNGFSYSNWRYYRVGTDVYNNFRYTNAFICGFNDEGKLKWNNSISLENVESSELDEKVQLSEVGSQLVLAYPQKGNIRADVIENDKKIIHNETYSIAALNNKSDDFPVHLSAWYNNHFIVYGYQKVVSQYQVNEIFYINKLKYKL